MVQELEYNSICLVIDSWEALKRIKNFEQVAGLMMFKR
jgi:hypothetical protein